MTRKADDSTYSFQVFAIYNINENLHREQMGLERACFRVRCLWAGPVRAAGAKQGAEASALGAKHEIYTPVTKRLRMASETVLARSECNNLSEKQVRQERALGSYYILFSNGGLLGRTWVFYCEACMMKYQ